jgi:hypothetical protein
MAALRRLYGDWNGSLSSGGSSNAYVLSPNRTIAAYVAGINFTFVANHANTGAATLNVSSLGVKDIRDRNGSALTGSEIASGGVVEVVYDNSNGYFRATNIVANSAASTPDASESVKGIVELATAAETLTGTSQTLAVTPYGMANLGSSLANTGYYKLPGGLIIQWGFGLLAQGDVTTLTFPLTFPNGCFSVVISGRENSVAYTRGNLHVTSYSSSSVSIYSPNLSTHYGHYIAIGY